MTTKINVIGTNYLWTDDLVDIAEQKIRDLLWQHKEITLCISSAEKLTEGLVKRIPEIRRQFPYNKIYVVGVEEKDLNTAFENTDYFWGIPKKYFTDILIYPEENWNLTPKMIEKYAKYGFSCNLAPDYTTWLLQESIIFAQFYDAAPLDMRLRLKPLIRDQIVQEVVPIRSPRINTVLLEHLQYDISAVEREVLKSTRKGQTDTEISETMGITVEKVSQIRTDAYKSLEAAFAKELLWQKGQKLTVLYKKQANMKKAYV